MAASPLAGRCIWLRPSGTCDWTLGGSGWMLEIQYRFSVPLERCCFNPWRRHLGADALGVLLTGMGDDGASGLLDIRRSGGYTIAEDESTAVVYGMPGAAVRMGAVCESLPLPSIAARVLELAAGRNSRESSARLPRRSSCRAILSKAGPKND